jgi:hypothetical protein
MKSPYRGFHIGFPGSGKTGATVSLAKAGYKLRMLDWTGNYLPITTYMDDSCDIDICLLQDKLIDNGNSIEPFGKPTAFGAGLKQLKDWKTERNGEPVSLGCSDDWGLDTIVVFDELTSLCRAAKYRAMNLNGNNLTSAVWGMAVQDVSNVITIAKSKNHHLIINCHKQILGAQDFTMQSGKSEESKAIASLVNEEIKEMKDKDLMPPRFYPVGMTKNSSMTVHGDLPIMLEFEQVTRMGKEMRVIKTQGSSIIDVKIPGLNLKKEYPIETGLADIFEAMGYKAPKK